MRQKAHLWAFCPLFQLVDKKFKITSITSAITLLEINNSQITSYHHLYRHRRNFNHHQIHSSDTQNMGISQCNPNEPISCIYSSEPILLQVCCWPRAASSIYAGPLFITEVTVTGWLWSLLRPTSLPQPLIWLFLWLCGFCLLTVALLSFFACLRFVHFVDLLALPNKYVLYGENVKIAADSDLRVRFLGFLILGRGDRACNRLLISGRRTGSSSSS